MTLPIVPGYLVTVRFPERDDGIRFGDRRRLADPVAHAQRGYFFDLCSWVTAGTWSILNKPLRPCWPL